MSPRIRLLCQAWLTATLASFLDVAYAEELQPYYGRISTSEIEMHLPSSVKVGGHGKGYYLYRKWQKQIPLTISLDADGRLKLIASPDDATSEEIFSINPAVLPVIGEQLQMPVTFGGRWTKGDRSTATFAATTHNIFDGVMSCEEMTEASELVLLPDMDLGIGSRSPVAIDFRCPAALHNLDISKNLFAVADEIRGMKVFTRCDGSSWYTHHRYGLYPLLVAGFVPDKSLQSSEHKDFVKARAYLADWSKAGIYNYRLYRNLLDEIERVRPLFESYFQERFDVPGSRDRRFAEHAISSFIYYAGGSYPYDWKPSNDEHSQLMAAIVSDGPKDLIADLIKKRQTVHGLLSNATNSLDMTQYLISLGADANEANWFGKTPLFYAVQFGNMAVAEALLQHGANINARYKSAAQLREDEPLACHYIESTLRTPLMHAAQHSTPEMIEFLIKNGADLTAIDERGYDALIYAQKAGKSDNETYIRSALNRDHPRQHSTSGQPFRRSSASDIPQS